MKWVTKLSWGFPNFNGVCPWGLIWFFPNFRRVREWGQILGSVHGGWYQLAWNSGHFTATVFLRTDFWNSLFIVFLVWASNFAGDLPKLFFLSRLGKYGCFHTECKQNSVADMFKITVAAGVSLHIFRSAIQRFGRTVGRPDLSDLCIDDRKRADNRTAMLLKKPCKLSKQRKTAAFVFGYECIKFRCSFPAQLALKRMYFSFKSRILRREESIWKKCSSYA